MSIDEKWKYFDVMSFVNVYTLWLKFGDSLAMISQQKWKE